MCGKIIIVMYRSWKHGLYGLHGRRCPLSEKRLLNPVSHFVLYFVSNALNQNKLTRIDAHEHCGCFALVESSWSACLACSIYMHKIYSPSNQWFCGEAAVKYMIIIMHPSLHGSYYGMALSVCMSDLLAKIWYACYGLFWITSSMMSLLNDILAYSSLINIGWNNIISFSMTKVVCDSPILNILCVSVIVIQLRSSASWKCLYQYAPPPGGFYCKQLTGDCLINEWGTFNVLWTK